jgi:hypothetical protein
MLRAALSYVDAGWPIVAGTMPADHARRRRGRVRALLGGGPPPECFCGSASRRFPAAHPLSPDWASTTDRLCRTIAWFARRLAAA